MSGSKAPLEIMQLAAEASQIRRRLSLCFPLEAEAIWRRACEITATTSLSLTEAAAEAEWEITLLGPE